MTERGVAQGTALEARTRTLRTELMEGKAAKAEVSLQNSLVKVYMS